ncbi:hypothetical protein SUGI_0191240 [Cryptomeria japonica]|nr:hypothetical protein SUGI_0191240 [Cryptomeria japonica]
MLEYSSKLGLDENDESGKARQIHYDDAAIDKLFDWSLVVGEEAMADEEEENGFIKAFKVTIFKYIDGEEAKAARDKEARKQTKADRKFAEVIVTKQAKYWEDLLKESMRNKKLRHSQRLEKEIAVRNNLFY